MSPRRKIITLVANREVRDRLSRPSYWVISALFVVLILAFGVGARLIGDSGPGTVHVAVTGPAARPVATELRAVARTTHRPAQVRTPASAQAARHLFDRGEVSLIVDTERAHLVTGDDPDPSTVAMAQQAWRVTRLHQNLARSGLSPAQADRVLRIPPLATHTVQSAPHTSTGALWAGTLAAALLFISLQIFGGQILAGVVEEKSTAVIEVLLARVEPVELLAGKVAGVGIVAIAQFVGMVIAGLVALAIAGTEVPGDVWAAVPMTVVWYLTGFAFYALLFALAGSLVSRQEDSQGAAAPITTALIGAYALLFVIAADPDSALATVLSLLPPFAPILMPLRMASGAASVVEVIVALALLVLGIAAVLRYTARVYSQVLLRRGARISWSAAWSIARGASG